MSSNINTAASFMLLLLLGICTAGNATDFPAPPDASVETVAGSVTSMGMNLNIRKFQTRQSMQSVLAFYRNLWLDQAAEVELPPWTMIGTREGDEYLNVQMQRNGEVTWGYLSISDLPEKIDNKTLAPPHAANFPRMSGTSVVDVQVSNDPGKKGRTILMTNNYSVKSNHDFYRGHYKKKGWRIIMDEQTEPRHGSYAMYVSKGSATVTLSIKKIDGKTAVVANEVKQGLLR